ncbi:Uncharacterised protein family UPF0157 (COG2320), partial [hydrothermal vent metagenome]
HNPDWIRQYDEEAACLTAVFQPILITIHHIGSTAIPSIKAKPIIDILIVVKTITAVDEYIKPMAAMGYICKGENGIAGRRYFRKGSDVHHTYHIHIYEEGHPEIGRHLNFRDYLRHHPQEAEVYSQLKEALAQQYFSDPQSYTSSKTSFIGNVLKQARLWRAKQAIL